MLRADGIRRFKRTVSNNYYNWLVTSWLDPQLRNAAVGWLRHPTLAPLRARMEPASAVRTMARDDAFDLSPAAARRYRLFVAATWERARREDALGLTERLAEPEIGTPVRLWSRGREISQDLANSIIECNYAARSGLVRDGARVAELGAGYGRLAHVFLAAADVVYCIFDIPPALAVSQWYLRELLGPDRVVPFDASRRSRATSPRSSPGRSRSSRPTSSSCSRTAGSISRRRSARFPRCPSPRPRTSSRCSRRSRRAR